MHDAGYLQFLRDAPAAWTAADAYREITRFTPLGGRSWATFFTVGDKLILRNQRELACFALGGGKARP